MILEVMVHTVDLEVLDARSVLAVVVHVVDPLLLELVVLV